MNKRKKDDDKLYRKTRPLAIDRDNGLCVLCGRRFDTVHHIVGRGVMGTSDLSNLACLCFYCHVPIAHGPKAKEIRRILQERNKQYEED